MNWKSIVLLLCVLCAQVLYANAAVARVVIPRGCAEACPHLDNQKMCGKNRVTHKLGTFDSECFFGRYNNCVHAHESE